MGMLITKLLEESEEEEVYATADFYGQRNVSQKKLEEFLQESIRKHKESWLE